MDEHYQLEAEILKQCIDRVNAKFRILKVRTEEMSLNIFSVIDFRMLSGLVGEVLITEIAETVPELVKNPNIDGYPDLLNCSIGEYKAHFDSWTKVDPSKFILYPHGGIEVKNTFGTKRSGVKIRQAKPRISQISGKLEWKAHHQYTNCLLALFSDFVEDCPQIVAAFYSDKLNESDWSKKQEPKEGSTMTSFSVIQKSGWHKLKSGIRICSTEKEYCEFLGVN